MALGIEASWLQTTAFERATPDPCKQVVIDIRVGVGREEDQSVGVIETQLLHLTLMLLQGGGDQRGEWDDPLLTCLGGAPDVLTGGIPVPPEGLADEDFTV